jgi:hypothetical protein
MSAHWAEPFQDYANKTEMAQGAWAWVGDAWSISTANPRTGTQCLKRVNAGYLGGSMTDGVNSARRVLKNPRPTMGCGYGFHIANLPDNEIPNVLGNRGIYVFNQWKNAANLEQCLLVLGTDGAIVAYSGTFMSLGQTWWERGTFLGRTRPCIQANTYHHIEQKVFCHSSNGTIQVRVDGQPIEWVSEDGSPTILSGKNTNVRGDGVFSQFQLGGGGDNSHPDSYFDDLHTWDTVAGLDPNDPTDWVGVAFIEWSPPVAHHQQDFAVTGASAEAATADLNDATYISSSVIGNRSVLEVAPLPLNVNKVIYKQVTIKGDKTDAGSANLDVGLRVGTSEQDAPGLIQKPMTSTKAFSSGILPSSPATGAQWDKSEVTNIVIENTTV